MAQLRHRVSQLFLCLCSRRMTGKSLTAPIFAEKSSSSTTDLNRSFQDRSSKAEPKADLPALHSPSRNSQGYDIAKKFSNKFTHLSPVWYELKRRAVGSFECFIGRQGFTDNIW